MEQSKNSPTPENLKYSFGDAKRAIHDGRFIKDYSKEIGIKTGGVSGDRVDTITEKAYQSANNLYEGNKEWVENHIKEAELLLPGLKKTEIKERFLNGLRLAVKRQYRTFKKDSPDEISSLEDKKYLNDVIFSYTADFILLLRAVQKTSSTPTAPNRMLKIAEMAHILSAKEYLGIVKKYSELEDWIIKEAAIKHPSDPEGFLDKFIETIARLRSDERYKKLEDWIIKEAAIKYPSDPEGFLDKVIETIARLRSDERYSELEDWIIKRAAIYYPSTKNKPDNPERFLDKVIETISRLRSDERYSELEDWIIKEAAINYPSDPEKYLNSLLQK